MLKKNNITTILFLIVAAVLVLPTVLNLIQGPAKTPGVFDEHYTLSQAAELSEQSGKPMLVLATADWCPPCQKLKRSTLTDPTVMEWIKENTIPVYLEDGENGQEIGSLGVRSYPTTMLIADGQILASIGGAVGADRYVNELSSVIASMPE